MASPYAFVTLLTSDSYLPGALTLAAALRDVHPSPPTPPEVPFQLVCMVTPESLDVSSIKLLRRAYDLVIGVEILEEDNAQGLQLLGRPDLHSVLTKLHVFRLTQYSKIIFLDADILPTRPLSHLFTLPHEFSAVPDVGWPDIFNSGLMVLSPGEEKFNALMDLSGSKGSWDGGDQGLLNEWRGDNWNRLSFTYNTTPTAAYTYAPAYTRFGSKISAIHFIGTNKPWNSIPWRASGARSSQQTTSEPLQAFDYGSLVDRWYAVYDKHYRSTPAVVTTLLPEYASSRYEAAWDQPASLGAEAMPSPIVTAQPTAPLSLEALRKIAIEGFAGPTGVHPTTQGEGAYIRLPLEGRIDLMRRPKVPKGGPETHHSSGSGDGPGDGPGAGSGSHGGGGANGGSGSGPAPPSGGQPHTPGPDELPPAPQHPPASLPRTDSFKPAQPQGQSAQDHQTYTHGQPALGHNGGQSFGQSIPQPYREAPQRARSPPMMVWNAAIEPPPNTQPVSNFPTDTYFPNAWDQSNTSHGRARERTPTPPSSVLFAAPSPSHIPKRLVREGHYTNVFGGKVETEPTPDLAKVKTIFPWEEKPRQMPARVFPSTDAPPPGVFISPSVASASSSPSSVSSQTLPSPPQFQQQPLLTSPPVGTINQVGNGFRNAWDTVPSIQKYASKLVRSPNGGTLAPAFDLMESRKKENMLFSRLPDSDDPSMDGDDEDTSDESDRDQGSARRRSKSMSSSQSRGSKYKKYASASTQTIPKETRDQGVQVNLLPIVANANSTDKDKETRSPNSNARSSGSTTPNENTARREWPRLRTPSGTSVSGTTAFSPLDERLSPLGSPTVGLRSPRMYPSPRGTALSLGDTPRQLIQDRPTAASRRFSSDTTSVSSPSSTAPPSSPPDGHPLGPGFSSTPIKKPAGRVWDPTRSVDVFKKGSEEVLARFLRGGNPS